MLRLELLSGQMHYNVYKDKYNVKSALSDKTLTMGSKEKENTRTGKQTASVYAAKIKTKIHNTSSFFKLSLKSNNKALALALVAQKQKSRELEAEVVRLRKDAQTTHFGLAFQRHKNKQLFAVIQEFYDSSLNWMSKAVDIFCNDEVPDSIDTEDNTSEGQNFEMEKEVECVPNRLTLCPQHHNVESEPVNTAMVKGATDSDASNQKKDNLALQNTINDSRMDITISDNASEILTVETNARTSRVTDEHQKKKNMCLSGKDCDGESEVEDSPISDYTSAMPKDMTTVTQQCSTTVENGQETESISARRQTHVTSRTKSHRRTCKQKEPNPDPRKTYTISKDPPNNIFNDCVNDLELQISEVSSKAVKIKAKEFNATHEPRRTFIVHDELRSEKSRRTKVSTLSMDHSSLFVDENVESVSSVCSEIAGTDKRLCDAAVQVKKHTNKTHAHPLSQFEKSNTQEKRGTYVIQTSQVLIECNVIEGSNRAEGSPEVEETQTSTLNIGLDVIAQHQKEPEPVSQDRSKEKAYNRECSQDLQIVLVEETSEFTSVPGKAKKPRKEGADSHKDRNVPTKEKSKSLTKKPKKCPVTVDENVSTRSPDVISLQKAATSGCRPLSNTLLPPWESHCLAAEEDLLDNLHAEMPEISSPSSVGKAGQTGHINMDVPNINLDQTNQEHESRCRKMYIISSSDNTASKEMANDAFSIFEQDRPCNKTDVSPVKSTSPLTMDKYNMTSGHFIEHLQFTEERPPWETLEDYSAILSDESCAYSPQPETRVQTVNIYEDQDSSLKTHFPEEGRVMKSLTNTVNADLGRPRRRAAPVTYKEPSINCKMRRGDKYSDTKFLNSPVFKDKKKKKKKRIKEC